MKFYVTTPIYYVNDLPHIGHAYTTVAADVLARWRRLHGDDVFFLTGTDEHGAKIAQAAEKCAQSPGQFCDGIVDGFKTAWQSLSITNDRFIRTTDPLHEETVKFFLKKLHDSGAIYHGKYEGTYCTGCEKFLSPDDLDENGACPDHRQKPVHHCEENYFFKLSSYRDQLLEILTNENHPQHIQVHPVERRNEIIGKLKVGLEDISISRAALAWGIPLPFDPKQTAYVWIDALINYISAIGYKDGTDEFKKLWPADLHLMAKDILWFHSVIWPALLLAAGLPLPKKVFAHGFFTIDGQKMSKSIGNVIRPADLIERFGLDASRYLLLALFPFGTDGDISYASLTEKYNTDLANNIGNLAARSISMAEKYFGGTVPAPGTGARLKVSGILAGMDGHFKNVEFHKAVDLVRQAVDTANRHIEATAPWKMAKENNPDLATVIHDLVNNLAIITFHLVPFIPNICAALWQQLGQSTPVEKAAAAWFAAPAETPIPAGTALAKGAILFPRIMPKKDAGK